MIDKAYIGLKVFLLSLLMSVVSATVCTAQVQEAGGSIYDGRIAVSRVSLCRSDSLVNLSLRVTYAPDMVKRGMVLYVSPQFIDASGHNLTLPPMMFGGRGRKAADADGRMHADVEFSGAYAPWLEGSSLCFVTEQLNGDGRRVRKSECLFDNVRIDGGQELHAAGYEIPPDEPEETDDAAEQPVNDAGLAVIPASQAQSDGSPLTDTLEIRFKLDSVMINMHFDGNMKRWNTFERNFKRRFAGKNPLGVRIDIYSGASPEGTASHNRWLGQERGESIRELIERRLPGRIGSIIIHNESARWQRLYDAVEASDEAWRDEVLAIISQPASVGDAGRDRREWQLRRHRNPDIWKKMLSTYLPPLRSGGSAIVSWDPSLLPAQRDTLVIRDTVVVMNTAPTIIYECNDCGQNDTVRSKRRELKPAERYPVWILRTNIPLLGTGTPNLQAEWSLGHNDHWSFNIEGVWSWWTFAHNVYANQIIYGSAEIRYWLGKRWRHHTLDGWHLGLGIGGGYGDLEWTNRGFQAEVYSGYLNIGWQKRFGSRRQWAFDMGIGLGYAYVPWRRYRGSQIFPEGKEEAQTDHLMWRETGRTHWPGVTHFNISIGYVFPQKDARWRRQKAEQRAALRNAELQRRDSLQAYGRYLRDSIRTAERQTLQEIELLPRSERKAAMDAYKAARRQAELDAKAANAQAKAERKEAEDQAKADKRQRRQQLKEEKAQYQAEKQRQRELARTPEGREALQREKAEAKAARQQAKAEAKAAKKQQKLDRKKEKIRSRMNVRHQRNEERLRRDMERADGKYRTIEH